MKNKLGEILFGRNLKLSGLLVLGVFVFVGLGCFGGRKTAGTIPSAYLGDWQGQDGSTLSIRNDGTGDYHAGNTKVDGGTAEVDEAKKTLSITFFGIGKTMKIDQPPSGSQMTLDGMIYRRRGGFSDTTSSNTSTSNSTISSPSTTSSPTNKNPFGSDDTSTSSQAGLPSSVEIETLVKATMSDFTSAVEDGDFSNFLQHTSSGFQASNTPEDLNRIFQVFITNKDRALPSLRQIDDTSVNFLPAPSLENVGGSKLMIANGNFPTSPSVVNFEMTYIMEGGRWKIQSIVVKM